MSAWTTERAAGSLLMAPLLFTLLALLIMVINGAYSAYLPSLQGSLAPMVPYADIRRFNLILFTASWIVQLLGFALLARLLLGAGSERLVIPAFTLLIVAAPLFVVAGTFHMSVEIWAAEEAARTGSIPGFYEPLRAWLGSFGVPYVANLVAVTGFGWAIVRTGFLPPWLGRLTMGWSLLWLLGSLVDVGMPALPLLMPAVIGAALLWK